MAAKSLPINDLIKMSKALIFLNCSEIQVISGLIYSLFYVIISFPCPCTITTLLQKKIFVSALALMPNFDVVTLNSGNASSGTSRVSIYCLLVASFFIKSIFYKYTFTQNRFFHII